MFSEEEKAKALEMLDECDGCITWAIRRLGYPTRTTMYNWIAEREAGASPRRRRKWSKYPASVRADALALVEGGMAPADVAARLGVLRTFSSLATTLYVPAMILETPVDVPTALEVPLSNSLTRF